MPTCFDDLLLLERPLVSMPLGTLRRGPGGGIYIQTASPSGTDWVLVINADGIWPYGVVTVAQDGSGDYTTIDEALANAGPGSNIIWVFPGTTQYALTTNIPADVQLIGMGGPSLCRILISTGILVGLHASITGFDFEVPDADITALNLVQEGRLSDCSFRITDGTVVNTPTFVAVSGDNCQLEDILWANAVVVGLRVSDGGACAARGIASLVNDLITGKAANFAIQVILGSLHLYDSQIILTDGGGVVVDGGSAYCEGVFIGCDFVLGSFATSGAIGSLHLSGCAGSVVGSAADHNYNIYGSELASFIPQAAGASVLPSRSGTAVVLSGNASIVVSSVLIGGVAYDGHPVFATLNEADGAISVQRATWDGSGNLTITLSAVTTGDRTVAWFIPK